MCNGYRLSDDKSGLSMDESNFGPQMVTMVIMVNVKKYIPVCDST